ncbi:MAG: hypothetical protein AMXMBFR53_39740 [Gemmatimonadota bacterium]
MFGRNDVLGLQWVAVDMDGGFITLAAQETDNPRMVGHERGHQTDVGTFSRPICTTTVYVGVSRTTIISEAQACLAKLARRVAGRPGAVEYIRHWERDEDIAMTTRNHLRYLEDSLREIRARHATGFTLAGSMESDRSDAAVEAEIEALRREGGRSAAAKEGGPRRAW